MRNKNSTLIDLLCENVEKTPGKTAFTFVGNGPAEKGYSYADLYVKTIRISNWLSTHAKGEAVLILLPTGIDYVATFLGCLFAGTLAIPAYPPRQNRNVKRISSILKDFPHLLGVTDRANLPTTEKTIASNPELSGLRLETVEALEIEGEDRWVRPDINEDSLAFLQYTSGSTSAPKGVMVTHKNLLHNEKLIKDTFKQTESSVIVGWLPLYHDMGLIGNMLQPLYLGAECVLMSPFSFLQRPALWLETITKFKATTSGGPNFAYDLCSNKISPVEKESLDLSSWSTAFNGSEPIRFETLDRFIREFGGVGFRRESFVPCYGLAESTLLVTGYSDRVGPRLLKVKPEEYKRNEIIPATETNGYDVLLVSCGKTRKGEIKIVDPQKKSACLSGEVGEIWLSSPSVAKGYWNKSEETENTFLVRLPDETDKRFLRTGDLGFIYDNELYVTGRLKDLIIIRGQNYYPQDIEKSIEACHRDLRPHSGAAFSVDSHGEERLVIVIEVNRRLTDSEDKILERIRQIVARDELQPLAVVLIKPGGIPKTSSGKIRRAEARRIYLENGFQEIARWEESNHQNQSVEDEKEAFFDSEEDWVTFQLARRLGIEPSDIEIDQPLLSYGIDSLRGIELLHKVEKRFGVQIPVARILNEFSVRDLVAEIKKAETSLSSSETSRKAAVHIDETLVSIGQETLWLIQKTNPSSSAYNIPVCFQLKGRYRLDSLERAINKVIERHETLRQKFSVTEGRLTAVAEEPKASWLQKIEAAGWPAEQLGNWIDRQANKAFDLENETPCRAYLVEKGETDHLVLLIFHHIAVDLWSLMNIFDELKRLYQSGQTNHSSNGDQSTASARYSLFAKKQKDLLEEPRGEKLRRYWEERLSGGIEQINFPADLPVKRFDSIVSGEYEFTLSREIAAQTDAFCRRHKVTPFALFLTVFKILLSVYSGQSRLFIGTPTNGRNSFDFSRTVGYFVNPVVISSQITGDLTFLQYLQQVKENSIGAFEHQEYPYPLLVQKLNPSRTNVSNPLFNVMYAMQQTHTWDKQLGAFLTGEAGTRIDFADIAIETVEARINTSFVDLSMSIIEKTAETAVKIVYASEKFSQQLIQRFAHHFQRLLEHCLDAPETRISKLEYLSAEEIGLYTGRSVGVPDSREKIFRPVYRYFEQQAAAAPERTALIHQMGELSYARLNEKANQLAHFLRNQGASRERLVGVCLPRTPNLIVTLLAILKTGAGYVPLDPAYPQERLKFIIEDTDLKWIITEESVQDHIPECRSQVIVFEEIKKDLENSGRENLFVECHQENVAYLIYTSGSTGRPKGVAIRHQSVSSLLEWSKSLYSSSEIEKVLAGTSICFDLSVYEIFVPLSRGGAVVLAKNVLELTEPWTNEIGITLLNTVPSAMNELIRLDSVPESVKVVNLAGEALPQKLVEQVYRRTRAEKLFNLYGPSEDTTYSTFSLTAPDEPSLIGRELPGTQGYVLNPDMRLVPLGAVGELYLGGSGLARGYWGRPDITAERFVPNPFSPLPGERLYRTGDLVKLREDGQYEYLGRQDHQVKIRGFRIELGEIEESIRRVSGVEECVAVTQGAGEQKEIVAFVTGRANPEEIRKLLCAQLPDFMIPALEKLEKMPLTPNGKIDRKLLPQRSAAIKVRQIRKADNETQEKLVEIWARVIDRPPQELSLDDNFFALGGHSLLATRLAFHINQAFSVEIPFRTIFDYPTIGDLSLQVEALQAKNEGYAPLPAVPRTGRMPLSPAQERLWFLDQLNPESPVYNMPVLIELKGPLDYEILAASVLRIVNRHEILRTKIILDNGVPYQKIMPPLRTFFPSIDDFTDRAESTREDAARRLAEEEARACFDLSRDLPFRIRLFKLRETEHWLLINIHHIAGDGWSMNILAQELTKIYNAAINQRDPEISELQIQYADFANWQRSNLQGPALARHLAYWKKNLGGEIPDIRLPGNDDATEPDNRGDALEFNLPADLSEQIERIALENEVTAFIVLLSAFQLLLSLYIGKNDIVVGSPVTGRTHPNTENLIGLFTNTLVLRNSFADTDSFIEILKAGKDVVLNAQEHQDVPFEVLVEELQPERDLSRTPLFQVMFVLQEEIPRLEFVGMESSLKRIFNGTAKFDLTIDVRRSKAGIDGHIEYKTGRFDRPFVIDFRDRFVGLLEALLRRPSARIGQVTDQLRAEIPRIAESKQKAGGRRETEKPRETETYEKTAKIGEYEAKVLAIWSKVLSKDVAQISLNDNFFAIGGHSLLATRLLFYLNREFGHRHPLSVVFKYPTISGFAVYLDRFSRRLVPAAEADPSLAVLEVDGSPLKLKKIVNHGRAPLSFAQQRLWLLDQIEEGASYNIVGGVRIKGDLDAAALEKSLNEIIIRHESLRTVFINENGELYQIVREFAPLQVGFSDWSLLDPESREAKLREEGEIEQKTRFDLNRAPLLRVKLIKLDKREFAVVIAIHHIISDGRSIEILLHEFAEIYRALINNEEPRLPLLRLQYSDYAYWIRNWMRGDVLQEHLAYWRKSLGGNLGNLKLQTAKNTSDANSARGKSYLKAIADDLWPRLDDYKRRSGVTHYTFLMTVFFTLLYKYSKQKDLIVGTAVAGRVDEEVEKLIGVFINMLPIRVIVDEDLTFEAMLNVVKEKVAAGLTYQQLPFDVLVDSLKIRREDSSTPLFQIAFGLQENHLRIQQAAGLEMAPLRFETELARYDLTLWILRDEDLKASWTFRSCMFDEQTISLMHLHFEEILRQALANPKLPLSKISLSETSDENRSSSSTLWKEKQMKSLIGGRKRELVRPKQ